MILHVSINGSCKNQNYLIIIIIYLFFYHPDFNCRFWNSTKSVLQMCIAANYFHKSRGLSPPVGNYTLPRRNYFKPISKFVIVVQNNGANIFILFVLQQKKRQIFFDAFFSVNMIKITKINNANHK